MIAKLKGLLDETGVDWAVIDVSGVGYLVHCSARTLSQLGEKGEACTVYTDLQVSENDMRLLGFADGAERDWFRLLTQVQGVGSKVALAILSALSIGEVQQACSNGDAAGPGAYHDQVDMLAHFLSRDVGWERPTYRGQPLFPRAPSGHFHHTPFVRVPHARQPMHPIRSLKLVPLLR